MGRPNLTIGAGERGKFCVSVRIINKACGFSSTVRRFSDEGERFRFDVFAYITSVYAFSRKARSVMHYANSFSITVSTFLPTAFVFSITVCGFIKYVRSFIKPVSTFIKLKWGRRRLRRPHLPRRGWLFEFSNVPFSRFIVIHTRPLIRQIIGNIKRERASGN